MKPHAIIASFTICLSLFLGADPTTQSLAQSVRRTSPSHSRDSDSTTRQSAILLLDSAIEELGEIEDIRARVSMAETIVKLLGKSRPERCHKMLDSLFDATLQLQKMGPSGKGERSDSNVILEKIIQIAAELDRSFAQSYIDRYVSIEDSSSEKSTASSPLSSRTATWYMKIATELFEKDPVLALSMAQRSLSMAVPPETLVFLAGLRKRDVVQANNIFGVALNGIKLRRGLDVNELLLLYAYVFSPTRVPVFSSQGLALFNIPSYQSVAANHYVDPALARQYLTTTTALVLDAQRYYPGNKEQLTSGLSGDFCLVSLLEPAARRYTPELSDVVSRQKHILAGYIGPDVQAESSSSVNRWNDMPNGVNSGAKDTNATLDLLLQRADQASDPTRKDQLYYRAAIIAARTKGADAAFDIVDKLSSQVRDQAKESIAFEISITAARKDRLDEAERLARRDSDLTRRAYVFTVIASSLLNDKSRDTVRAMEFLNEVEHFAAQLDKDVEKVAVLVGAAAVASRLDAARAADLLRQAIRVANKINNFSGDTRVPRGLDIGGLLFAYTLYNDEFTLADAIIRLGTNDFDQTVGDIRTFKNHLPRLQMTIALCNGILSNSPLP